MKFKLYILFILSSLLIIPCSAQSNQAEKERNARIEWFRDARFGMFIHWGLYSAAAGEWNGVTTPAIGEWIQNTLKIPNKDYETLASKFTLENYNPEKWVLMAKNAGVKYIVITSKHHDGFCLFPSKVSDYNITRTPYKKDPLQELVAACHKYGMKIGFYYSHRQDWHEEDAAYLPKEYDNHFGKPKSEVKPNFDRYMTNKAIPQVREILTNYGPVSLIWYDTPMDITKKQSQTFANVVRELQPQCLINGRIGYNLGDYGPLGDNELPCSKAKTDLEMVATMNNTWGYKKSDNHWKSPNAILCSLIECASRGVNYMINIGPMADGTVPQPSIDTFQYIGTWMHANSDAIYGTKANPFNDNFPWGFVTQKGNKLYLIINQKPKNNQIILKGVKGQLVSAKILKNGQTLQTSNNGQIKIKLPKLDYAEIPVVKLTFNPKQAFSVNAKNYANEGIISIPAASGIIIPNAKNANKTIEWQNYNGTTSQGKEGCLTIAIGGYTDNFNERTGKLSLSCEIEQPGQYEVRLYSSRHHSRSFTEGTYVSLNVDGKDFNHCLLKKNEELANTRQKSYPEVWSRIGYIDFNKTGTKKLQLSIDQLGTSKQLSAVGEDLGTEKDRNLRVMRIELRKVY